MLGVAALAIGMVIVGPATPTGAAFSGPSVGPRAQMQLPEDRRPIVAEVMTDGVPVRAYPKQDSDIRRHVNTGDLLRVTGEAPGIDGDTNTWYATTEGFIQREVLQPASGQAPEAWTLPERDAAPNGWWGVAKSEANVRTMASADAPLVGTLVTGQRVKVLGDEQGVPVGGDATWYRIDGGRYAGGRVHGSLIDKTDQPTPNTAAPDPAPADGTWITVDRGARTLTFVQGGNPVFTTYITIGKAGAETPTGRHELISKLRYDDMSSQRNPDATNSYFLPNVPFAQYYREDGSAIHGTYWHDNFGSSESQGCINLTLTDAAYLFELTSPTIEDGQSAAWSMGGSTPVNIVD